MKIQRQLIVLSITLLSVAGVVWLGLTAVTAAPLANFVGINGAACAYATIGDAIAAADSGDTIYLSPNTYNETLGTVNMDLHFTAATADCTTATPGANPSNYQINGGGTAAFQGGLVHVAPGRTVTFTTFLMRNTEAIFGGVVYVAEGATATFYRSNLYDGHADSSGGLVYVAPDASLFMQNTLLYNGDAGLAGGGIYVEGDAYFNGSQSRNNSAAEGGSMAIVGDGHLVLQQNSHVGSLMGLVPNTADSGGGIHMTGHAQLELFDTSSVGWNEALVGHGGGIYADGNVTIDLYDNSRVYANQANLLGGGIYAANGASVRLHDASQVGDSDPANGNSALRGGGIYANGAEQVTLAGNTAVQHNHAGEDGGGIFVNASLLTMSGGLIHANEAGIHGGGLAMAGSSAHLTDVQISANEAQENGGGIYQSVGVAVDVYTIITNSQIISNTALLSGGGVATEQMPFVMWDSDGSSRLAGNSAGLNGGGAYSTNSGGIMFMADTAVSHVYIEDNTAGGDGGGLYSDNQGNVLIGGEVWLHENAALNSGGGIYQTGGVLIAIGLTDLRPHIASNEALNGNGGGIYLSDVGTGSNSRLRNVTISNNTADNQGGGLYVTQNSEVALENNLIHDNTATEGGGLLVSNAAVSIIPHGESCTNASLPANQYCSELRGNSASAFSGGAVQLQLGAELVLEYTAVISNSAALGSGVYSASNGDQLEITNSLFSHNTGKALFIANDAFLDLVQNTFADNEWAIDIDDAGANASQDNNIIWGNGFGVESAIAVPPNCSISQNGTFGNIADPLFHTTLRGDYRLSSSSPALDACAIGTDVDLDGTPRPQGTNYDLGAFEAGRPLLLFHTALPVTEGDAGAAILPFSVALSEASFEVVSVTVTAVAQTALEGVDFVPFAETITFPAGSISQTVELQITGDLVYEADETFALQLSDVQGAELTTASAIVTITNDDPLPMLTMTQASAAEGNNGTTSLSFTFEISHPSAFPITVAYSTGDGSDTAVAGVDYEALSGTLSMMPGQTEAEVVVTVYGDETEETDEEFTFRLFDPQGVILESSSVMGTIVNDDGSDYHIFLPMIIR